MAWKKVREVLDLIRQFHAELGEYYRSVSEQSENERVKMLLEYMERHEKQFNAALNEFEQAAGESVLDTWLQYAPVEEVTDQIEAAKIRPEMDTDQVIEIALRVDQKLVELYRQLAAETGAPEIRELFGNLLQMEETKDQKYVRSQQFD